jgi:hypothetical protein
MEKDTTYNGWTNYATWRINLEVFDGNEILSELATDCTTVLQFSEVLKQYTLDLILESIGEPNSLIQGWANGFVDECNFYEIAQHYTELLFNIKEA